MYNPIALTRWLLLQTDVDHGANLISSILVTGLPSVYIIRHDPFALTRHPHPGTLMNHGAHIIRPKVVNISADRHPGYPMTQIE